MSQRRLHHEQPKSFAFTPGNQAWAEEQIAKYPEGRQASAVIPLLWRAQEQEGWVTKPAIETVARMLGLAEIRVLEVATFYFMFQLQPVGSVAHIQVCGTTSCMICGAEDLIGVCRSKIAGAPHALSSDGKFSWEEVECLGACSNAPMVQIGKDYYEDLTAESFAELLDRFAAGEVPAPGSQKGRFASEPLGGLTSLNGRDRDHDANASNTLARELGDTIMRITGEDRAHADRQPGQPETPPPPEDEPDGGDRFVKAPSASAMAEKPDVGGGQEDVPLEGEAGDTRPTEPAPKAKAHRTAPDDDQAEPAPRRQPHGVAADLPGGAGPGGGAEGPEHEPELMARPDGSADDLKRINGIGPKIESLLNELGVWHFRQIAAWGPEEIAWVEHRLSFKGRVARDGWVEQAGALAGERP